MRSVIDELDEAERRATPGPWKYDSGNSEIETRNKEYFRSTVCVRADLVEKCRHHEEFNLTPEKPIYPCADMEFIELMRNNIRALIDIARVAKEVQLYAHENLLPHKLFLNLDEALSKLENK